MANHQPDLERGEAVHAEACVACRGANLEGEADWRSVRTGRQAAGAAA